MRSCGVRGACDRRGSSRDDTRGVCRIICRRGAPLAPRARYSGTVRCEPNPADPASARVKRGVDLAERLGIHAAATSMVQAGAYPPIQRRPKGSPRSSIHPSWCLCCRLRLSQEWRREHQSDHDHVLGIERHIVHLRREGHLLGQPRFPNRLIRCLRSWVEP